MKKGLCFCLSAMILSSAPGTLPAQDYDYHPALSDRFYASFGAFRSNNAFKAKADNPGADNSLPGDDVDFGKSLHVSEHSTLFDLNLRWTFGKKKKWFLAGQYFSNDATGETVLTEDIEWDGLTFREGTFVGAGIDLAVTRLFIGRSFIKNEQNDFGAGIGLHNLDLETFIEGEIKVDDETTEFQR